MKNSTQLMLAGISLLVLFGIGTEGVRAQPPLTRPGMPPVTPPALSPYLNLQRPGNSAGVRSSMVACEPAPQRGLSTARNETASTGR